MGMDKTSNPGDEDCHDQLHHENNAMNNFEGLKPTEFAPDLEGLTASDFEYLHATEGLSREAWEGLSVNERLEALQTLECKLAEIQGRDPVLVLYSETPGENGHYDPETRTITLNAEQLSNPRQRLELVDTIAHEGRHAYQHYATEHPGFHPDAREVEAWRENFVHYRNGTKEGLLDYRLQPIEADAWSYGHLVKDAFSFADMDSRRRNTLNA